MAASSTATLTRPHSNAPQHFDYSSSHEPRNGGSNSAKKCKVVMVLSETEVIGGRVLLGFKETEVRLMVAMEVQGADSC